MRGLFTSIAAIGIAAMLVIAPANAGETFKIGWSHYTDGSINTPTEACPNNAEMVRG